MRHFKLVLLAVIATIAIAGFATVPAYAQGTKNAITVQPASLYFDLSGAADKKVSMLTIQNDYDIELSMTAELKGIDETTGKIVPIGDPDEVILNSLKISETEFSVPPHGKYFLTVVASDSGAIPPGGHYATLVLSDQTGSGQQSSILSQVSVGIFLVKRDGLVAKLELTKHTLNNAIFRLPITVDLELFNDGNVHLTPRASVRILDSNNNVVGEAVFNESSQVLLPNKLMPVQSDIKNVKNFYVPKKLTLEISYRADEIDGVKTYKETFWYVPVAYAYIAIGFALFLIYWGVKNRENIKEKIPFKKPAKKP